MATLDQAGIDVDKLLRINKAPGPVRDILHAFILDAGQHISSDRTGELPTLREGLVFKPVKSSRLRK